MFHSFLRRLLFNAATAEPLTEQTATGNPASFTANVAKPLKGLTIPIESESGIAGLTIYRTGVNVWNEEWEKGRLDGSGGDVASDENIRTKGFIPVVPGKTYYIKYSLPGGGASGKRPSDLQVLRGSSQRASMPTQKKPGETRGQTKR